MLKGILKSWKTTVIGIGTIFIGIKAILTGQSNAEAISSIIAGIGLIFAKDGDVSGN